MKKCDDCGVEVPNTIFVWFTNKDWKKMGLKPNNFLCDYCMVPRMRKLFEDSQKRWGIFINGNDIRDDDSIMKNKPIDFDGGIGYDITVRETRARP